MKSTKICIGNSDSRYKRSSSYKLPPFSLFFSHLSLLVLHSSYSLSLSLSQNKRKMASSSSPVQVSLSLLYHIFVYTHSLLYNYLIMDNLSVKFSAFWDVVFAATSRNWNWVDLGVGRWVPMSEEESWRRPLPQAIKKYLRVATATAAIWRSRTVCGPAMPGLISSHSQLSYTICIYLYNYLLYVYINICMQLLFLSYF